MRVLFKTLAITAAMFLSPATYAQSGGDDKEVEEAPDTPRPPTELSAEAQAAVAGLNRFTLAMYQASRTPNQSHVISPASISIAMGIAYRGARGTTAEEMARVLHYGAAPVPYTAANGELLRSLSFAGRDYRLTVANSLFVQNGFPFEQDFTADMTRHYDAGFQPLDFASDPAAARGVINGWVSDRTNGRIPQLLGETAIRPATRSVLVNTIYFRGRWASQFHAVATQQQPFIREDGTQAPVPLMRQQEGYSLIERGGVQAIAMPFASAEMDMVVMLPRRADRLAQFERQLTPAALDGWLRDLGAAEQQLAQLLLPRFSIRFQDDVRPQIETMGLRAPFGADADFRAMGPEGLAIGSIVHATTIDIDEAGAEATAATAVGITVTSGGPRRPPPRPILFRADRPFLYLIRDRRSGAILFIGRYNGPAAE